MISVDNHVPIPVSKKKRVEAKQQATLFEQYANAYQRVHVLRPELRGIVNGWYSISTIEQRVTSRRLKELTRMLKDRIKDR